jgi:hypothetical protein
VVPVWQIALIITACLASLWVVIRILSRRSASHPFQQVTNQLLEHLESIGVTAQPHEVESSKVRKREEGYRVTLRQLAGFRIRLRRIQFIEIWREAKKGKNESAIEDEITYVITFEPGTKLGRIPILTNIVGIRMAEGKSRFKWRGFEWGKVPLLVDKLKADKALNSKLRKHISQDMADDLRVRALSGNRVGITMVYNPHCLPTREFLTCMEDIAEHVNEYVTERNIEREQQEA